MIFRESKRIRMSTSTPTPKHGFLDRNQSILAFNERVLDWARRPAVPLLERLRYLTIVSSNLDEFFEVRFAPQLAAFVSNEQRGAVTAQTFREVAAKVHSLVDLQYVILNEELLPILEKRGIKIVAHSERSPTQRRWVKEYFAAEVQPLLLPIGLDPSHPFPQVANKSLNFIVRLAGAMPLGAKTKWPSSRSRARCRVICACRMRATAKPRVSSRFRA